MAERIGFVGVGRMGANMARRLKDAGFPIAAVFDLKPKAAAALATEVGAEATKSLARVTEAADVIFTVVSNDEAMDEIFDVRSKRLLHRAGGKLFINCATLSPRIQIEIESRVIRAGAQCLEACMASSVPQARQGSLYLMCGGETESFQRAKPILAKLGQSVRHVGRAGEAAKLKAVVNMVMNINTAALAEGLGLGHSLGLDLGMLREVFSQTGANSRVLQTDGEDMQNREHSCFFSAEHAAKDSGIALALAKEQKLELPLATATLKQFTRLVKEGLGHLDKSGVAELTFKGRLKSKAKGKSKGKAKAPAKAKSKKR